MKSVPIFGDLLDNTIDTVLSNFQNKKRKQFLDIISKDANITSEMVNDIDFIMEYAKTLKAINRVTINEKVKYFAYLFKNSYCVNEKIETDLYDEYLRVLENLSFREIEYLCFLKEFELINKTDNQKNIDKNYWYKFMDKFSIVFSMDKFKHYDIYKRLVRSGFINEKLKYNGEIQEEGNNRHRISYIEDDVEYFYTTDYFQDFYYRIINSIGDLC